MFYLVAGIRLRFLTANAADINDPPFGQIGKVVVSRFIMVRAASLWRPLTNSRAGIARRKKPAALTDRQGAQLSRGDEGAGRGAVRPTVNYCPFSATR